MDCGVGDRVWSVEVACGEVVCRGYTASFHHHLVSLAVWNLRLVFLVLVAEVNTLSATLFRQRKPVGVIWSDLRHFCSYSSEFRHFCSSCLRRKWNAYSLCVVFCIVYSFWMYTVYVWKYLITQTASRVFVVRSFYMHERCNGRVFHATRLYRKKLAYNVNVTLSYTHEELVRLFLARGCRTPVCLLSRWILSRKVNQGIPWSRHFVAFIRPGRPFQLNLYNSIPFCEHIP